MKKSTHAAVAFALGIATILTPFSALARKTPHSLISDSSIKQVAYDQNQVYEIVGTYGYQTSIEFASDELIKVVTLGDSIAWQTVPYQNRLFIKPVEPHASTNLTVITNKRAYYFKLSSAKKNSAKTFLVRFIYPNTGLKTYQTSSAYVKKSVGLNPENLNLNYETAGDARDIRLSKVFDDGQFTYFLFKAYSEIPSVYVVGSDGTESIVNTRREGKYLVAERTAANFTLRNGTVHLCVKNNANSGV